MVVNEESGGGSLSMKRENQKSNVFGMWVKLKMPKQEDVDGVGFGETMKKDSSSNISEKRVCHICLKAFSSGKALGGHMRSHVQLSHHSKIKLHQTITFKNPNPSPSEKSINCVICGKNFPSMKALFGHMRCHPDRDWRGIHPPPKNGSSPSPSSSPASSSLSDAGDGDPPNKTDDDRVEFVEKERALDLTESLRRWPLTAKRGRKASAAGAGSSSELDDDEDGLHEAVSFLMMLAEGRRKDFGGDHDDKMKVQMKKKKRKKVKLCDLNLHDQKCDDRSNNNIPTCGKLLEFDLNEVPQ